MQSDKELLWQYASARSDEAFAELVRRHVNLVYSAAVRQVGGDSHLAHDVAQSVFTDLARKAAALSRRESLTGWLYTSTHFAASKLVRAENRRREREEQFMSDPVNHPSAELDWETLRPILDAAMHGLHETDREAVLLRYFENRPYADVGAKLGLNENAARMRVDRALEKLRTVLARRAITTTSALAAVISANAVQVAPSSLAVTLTKSSLVAAGAGTSFALSKLLTLSQLKVGMGAIVVAGVAAAMVVQHRSQQQLQNENASLRQQFAQLKSDNANLANDVVAKNDAQTAASQQMAELLQLRSQVTQLRTMTNAPAATVAPPATDDVSATKKAHILLKMKLVSVPESVLQTSAAGWASAANGANLLSEQQYQGFDGLMEKDDKVRTIGHPAVLALNGRKARTFVGANVPFNGTNVNLGSTLDVVPFYSPDSSIFTLNVAVQYNQLTGDPSQPILETLQSTNQVNLFPGQTVALKTKITSAGILEYTSDLPNRPGILLMFITPTLADEAGNKLTPADKIEME